MEREYKIGQPVIYVDEMGRRHDALVTVWWAHKYVKDDPDSFDSFDHRTSSDATEHGRFMKEHSGAEPGCNLLFVSSDCAKHDSYGRQIERESSVTHKNASGMSGRYWCWPDE